MRTYQKIKNVGGGFTYEVMNAVQGLYNSAKYSDIVAMGYYQKKCDEWEIEMWKQNKITFLASKDNCVGVPAMALNEIMLMEVA